MLTSPKQPEPPIAKTMLLLIVDGLATSSARELLESNWPKWHCLVSITIYKPNTSFGKPSQNIHPKQSQAIVKYYNQTIMKHYNTDFCLI